MDQLTADQQTALSVLKASDNIFLTGAAGSGKSYLLRHFLQGQKIPVLASTGAAAILVGGRTFHSFFGLGIMEGGVDATIQRALNDKRVRKRLQKAHTVVIDEVSMISGPLLRTAERIARLAREKDIPWGGLRIIAVGDFAQLPPVNPFSRKKEWAFLDTVWSESSFQTLILEKIMRTTDPQFLTVLNQVRKGLVDQGVSDFLNERREAVPSDDVTRLFPHRAHVESYNLEKLGEIPGPVQSFQTEYTGRALDIENFKKHSPIPEAIYLKPEALVMIRQNDPEGRWVNGSCGRVEKMKENALQIRLESGRCVELERAEFTLLNAEGAPVVSARNFPVTLAWAMTIHKAQGATLDRMLVDLRKIWEPGQAYVALSRVRQKEGLFIEGWRREAIFADPQVKAFLAGGKQHEEPLSSVQPHVVSVGLSF